jgi:beta-lactam-binding protein with PASTA domain
MRAKGARKIAMPNLVGYSTRQALAELEARGLEVGKLIYDRSVPTTNNVLKQRYKGRDIQPGDSLEAESSVDLVLGLGRSDDETMIPDVIGKKAYEAKKLLHEYYLNVKLKYDRGVKSYSDRSRAIVYEQTPEATDLPVKMGGEQSNVTLSLRLETAEE